MSKLLLVNMGGHGHVNPTLALTQELVARGHEVLYAVPQPFAEAVKATGATFKAYQSVWGSASAPTRQTMKELLPLLPVRFLKEAINVLPQLLEWARSERPDAVLYDSMCLGGRFLAQALGIPAVALHASYASNEHFSLGKEFALGTPAPEVLAEFEVLMGQLTDQYGVQPLTPRQLFVHVEALNLVFLPRSFQIAGETFDDRYVFCGPCIAPRPTSGSWHPALAESRPYMFISLGTVFSNWPEFFHMCFDAFGGTDWQVLMSVSDRVNPELLAHAPANITVAPHFPQLDVLPHMRVFVCHGGMNSTMEALYFGVPLVVIPQMPEQDVTARRVEALGIGKALDRDSVTAAELAHAVATVATDAAIRANVATMQHDVHQGGGYRRGADAVERFTASLLARRQAAPEDRTHHASP